jgi:hypothetical protein
MLLVAMVQLVFSGNLAELLVLSFLLQMATVALVDISQR